ncbi:hypothetical protein EKD16_04870 [Streptomonospora litoralis]|uniref:Uncharacterized protein n=1 Tax=Streptomonospora litoralis TaxID=2498135 RepID=A0A4P6Q0S5_9ACTN|nr:hypothetical protein EKD16_04870 [Streptomonospora litoralis]
MLRRPPTARMHRRLPPGHRFRHRLGPPPRLPRPGCRRLRRHGEAADRPRVRPTRAGTRVRCARCRATVPRHRRHRGLRGGRGAGVERCGRVGGRGGRVRCGGGRGDGARWPRCDHPRRLRAAGIVTAGSIGCTIRGRGGTWEVLRGWWLVGCERRAADGGGPRRCGTGDVRITIELHRSRISHPGSSACGRPAAAAGAERAHHLPTTPVEHVLEIRTELTVRTAFPHRTARDIPIRLRLARTERSRPTDRRRRSNPAPSGTTRDHPGARDQNLLYSLERLGSDPASSQCGAPVARGSVAASATTPPRPVRYLLPKSARPHPPPVRPRPRRRLRARPEPGRRRRRMRRPRPERRRP